MGMGARHSQGETAWSGSDLGGRRGQRQRPGSQTSWRYSSGEDVTPSRCLGNRLQEAAGLVCLIEEEAYEHGPTVEDVNGRMSKEPLESLAKILVQHEHPDRK